MEIYTKPFCRSLPWKSVALANLLEIMKKIVVSFPNLFFLYFSVYFCVLFCLSALEFCNWTLKTFFHDLCMHFNLMLNSCAFSFYSVLFVGKLRFAHLHSLSALLEHFANSITFWMFVIFIIKWLSAVLALHSLLLLTVVICKHYFTNG